MGYDHNKMLIENLNNLFERSEIEFDIGTGKRRVSLLGLLLLMALLAATMLVGYLPLSNGEYLTTMDILNQSTAGAKCFTVLMVLFAVVLVLLPIKKVKEPPKKPKQNPSVRDFETTDIAGRKGYKFGKRGFA